MAYCEMTRCEYNARAVVDIREILNNNKVVLENFEHPVYLYKSNIINDIYPKDYVKINVPEHIANSLVESYKNIKSKISTVTSSNLPVNDLYNAVTDAKNILSVTSLNMSQDDNNIVLEHHVNDNINAFIANGMVYIL